MCVHYVYLLCIYKYKHMHVYCHAKAKDRNLIYILGHSRHPFIMYISILSQFRCFSEKIMGRLNRNFEKPRRDQGRTSYNISYESIDVIFCFGVNYLLNAKLPII